MTRPRTTPAKRKLQHEDSSETVGKDSSKDESSAVQVNITDEVADGSPDWPASLAGIDDRPSTPSRPDLDPVGTFKSDPIYLDNCRITDLEVIATSGRHIVVNSRSRLDLCTDVINAPTFRFYGTKLKANLAGCQEKDQWTIALAMADKDIARTKYLIQRVLERHCNSSTKYSKEAKDAAERLNWKHPINEKPDQKFAWFNFNYNRLPKDRRGEWDAVYDGSTMEKIDAWSCENWQGNSVIGVEAQLAIRNLGDKDLTKAVPAFAFGTVFYLGDEDRAYEEIPVSPAKYRSRRRPAPLEDDPSFQLVD